MVDDADPIARLSLGHVVRGHQHRHAFFAQRGDAFPQVTAALRIEAQRRLIEEQHARAMHDCARKLEAALHAAGERAHAAVADFGKGGPNQRLLDCFGARILRDAVEHGMNVQVLFGCQALIDGRVLEHHAQLPAHLCRVLDHVKAHHLGRARGGRGQRGEHMHDGGLARTVRTQEGEELASGHGERYGIGRGYVSVATADGQRLNRWGRLSHQRHRSLPAHERTPLRPTLSHSIQGGNERTS